MFNPKEYVYVIFEFLIKVYLDMLALLEKENLLSIKIETVR